MADSRNGHVPPLSPSQKSNGASLSANVEAILSFIDGAGITSSKLVCEHFPISRMTVYRALKQLEEMNYITREHGLIKMRTLGDFSTRLHLHNEAKRRIAEWTVYNLIPPHSSIVIESGTTVGFAVPYLAAKSPSVVLSNGLEVIELARTYLKETDILGSGGFLHHSRFIGEDAVRFFGQHHADICLISAGACSVEHGCMDINKLESEVKRNMLQNVRKRILVVDRSKINKNSVSKFAEIRQFDHLVTEAGADSEFVQKVREYGVACHLVGDTSIVQGKT